ncbi:hypothetical protein MRX96_037924 [Rhipicephalus microplus]
MKEKRMKTRTVWEKWVLKMEHLNISQPRFFTKEAISSRGEGANVADNTVHKSTQEPEFEAGKAKRQALPPKDESDSEIPGVESSQKTRC